MCLCRDRIWSEINPNGIYVYIDKFLLNDVLLILDLHRFEILDA